MARPKQTEGEYLVGRSFNPDKNGDVDELKGMTATIIDYVQEVCGDVRTMDIAIRKYEEACMWAVKSVTKPDRNV